VKKSAIITGITGQDGAYLAQFLLKKGYKVYGGIRRGYNSDFSKLSFLGIKDNIEFIDFELLEYTNICKVLQKYQPDEFYNLAAQSFVGVSFDLPIYTTQVDALGVAYILSSINFRNVWNGTRDSTIRKNSILSKKSIRCCKALCPFFNGKL
jgi:GDPmannose 4,6-dehydratase